MSVDKITRYSCDFCHMKNSSYSRGDAITETYEAENLPRWWFIVNDELHACNNCGHKLHKILNELDVPHDFVCNEYNEKTTYLGIVRVTSDKS